MKSSVRISDRACLKTSVLLVAMLFSLCCLFSSAQAQEPKKDPRNPMDPDQHPFPKRIDFPYEFPKEAEWMNTSGRLRLADLKGKFVVLDFWTYCCINCMHILPELKKLEKAYPNELVVIGVHSAKFDTEKDADNIREAILRYEIAHPVVNDPDHQIWDSIGINSWPSLLLIDPAGQAVWFKNGETKFEQLDEILKRSIPYYREKKLLDEKPLHFELHSFSQEPTPLRFPGKVIADAELKKLFIADSNHNRVVVSDLNGKIETVIGSGEIGLLDGNFETAKFDHPQGMYRHGDFLYVADTENHALRKVDLSKRQVTTIAGIGSQASSGFPGLDELGPFGPLPERWIGKPQVTALNSPWDLWVHGDSLYIAMAGPHQIWKMPLDESEIGPYAGNGREDIVDGDLLPKEPYALGFSSFAQPSGLTSDGTWLYVADSEGSSIRAVPFDPRAKVRTVVGTAEEPFGRLFKFGDVDGPKEKALLQHCIGAAFHDGKIYVCDTYNNKIKVVDAATGAVETLVGTGKPGGSDDAPEFDEPAGISFADGFLFVADTNNHAIRKIELATKKVSTIQFDGLQSPKKSNRPKPTFENVTTLEAKEISVQRKDGQVVIPISFQLAPGWKINSLAPMSIFVEVEGASGPLDRTGKLQELLPVANPAGEVNFQIPASAEGEAGLKVSFNVYYCQEGGEGLCRVRAYSLPLKLKVVAEETKVEPIKIGIEP